MNHKEWKEKDAKYVIRSWECEAEPTVIVGGEGCRVKDPDGREYIDCSSGLFVMGVGYQHPEVVKAVQVQAGKLMHTCMRQANIPAIELAERVAKICPGELNKSYYCSGGAEAVEVAMKMVKQHTGRYEIVALRNAYHGLTFGAMSLTSPAAFRSGFGPLLWGVLRIPSFYCYRCHLSRERCDLWCAREFEKLLKDQAASCSHTNSIAAIIVELVQGVGGACAPDGWAEIIRKTCDEFGVLLIVDEIQAGLGRTGKMLSCDHWSLAPDMITLAKGIGGGLPLGMTVTTDEIAKNFNTGTTPTGAGNPVACAAGLAFLDALEKENLCGNAAKMGALLSGELGERVPEKFIGEIRLTGLMGGIELVKERKSKEPFDKKTMAKIQTLLLEKGVILSLSGPLGNVLRLQPPLCINADEVEFVAKAVGEAVGEVENLI